ncbi:MAG TPA: hypothetical protein VI318_20425 [Baekduia sp.]
MTTAIEGQRFISGGGRAASLALLRARVSRLAGVEVVVDDDAGAAAAAARRGAARLLIDVRGTGLSGFEIGRRMRAFSGVPLDFCREHRLVVVFDEDEEIAARGERLLFALAHACHDAPASV